MKRDSLSRIVDQPPSPHSVTRPSGTGKVGWALASARAGAGARGGGWPNRRGGEGNPAAAANPCSQRTVDQR
jgi:hypothetical protein